MTEILDDFMSERHKACVQILISCLNPKLYHVLTKLTAQSKTNKKLAKLPRQHLSIILNSISLQYVFNRVVNYVAKLRKVTTNCEFNCEHCFVVKEDMCKMFICHLM